MSWNATGRIGLVTGASCALGREVTKRLALKHGVRIACVSRRPEMDWIPENCTAFQADITKSTDCDALLKSVKSQMGPVSIVVHCAGVTLNKLHMRTTDEDYDFIMNTNVRGALNVSRAALRHGGMLHVGDGSMLFIGSVVGLAGNEGQVLYGASKAALCGASKCLAREYGSKKIRFNVVSPGLIDGPGMATTLSAEQRERWRLQSPLGRLATPSDVAEVVVNTLLSPCINGQNIVVDGGAT